MARPLAVLLLAFGALALTALACNDEGDFLLEEEPEATGTPAFFQRSPLPSPQPSPVGSPLAPNATPVTPFQVSAEESANRRVSPSTQGAVAGSLHPGDKADVVAKIRGEPVEAGNDVWYQLADGSFVYSGAVKEVRQ